MQQKNEIVVEQAMHANESFNVHGKLHNNVSKNMNKNSELIFKTSIGYRSQYFTYFWAKRSEISRTFDAKMGCKLSFTNKTV